MIPTALALIAAVAIIGYVVAVSLGKQPSRELMTVAIIAILASCTSAHELSEKKGSLFNFQVEQPAAPAK
ncbi:hypothetical protein [Acidovorax sp. BL-A-41-H1]|uniref:hypothetical protein n=1 Tax=Acidovorax sp. BL-A-41-H1 TaxID=3421102 RepID=UPI003F79549F